MNAEKHIYDRLMEVFSEAGTVAIMGNWFAESGFNSNNLQNSFNKKLGMTDEEYTKAVNDGSYNNFIHDGAGYGLAQWTFWSRKQGLLNYANGLGCSIDDLDMQIDYALIELGRKSSLYKLLRESRDYALCTVEVLTKYERPADQGEAEQKKRIGYAKELYKKYLEEETFMSNEKEIIMVLEAGHGKNTKGKRCLKSIDANETREWVLNSRIAEKVEKELSGYNVKIIRADDITGERDVPLEERVQIANNANADVYISIHHNAGINGGNGGGTIVFHYSSKPIRSTQSQDLYDLLVSNTGLVGNRSEKVKKYPYYVVKNTTMPAFLIENGFMDSKTDVPIILTEEHADATATAIVEFLKKDFGVKKSVVSDKKPTVNNGKKPVYKVQVGAYSVKANAENTKKILEHAGFDAIIVEE